MLEFQLFRIKVYPSNQLDFFEPQRSRPEILRETITSSPSAELRKGMIWHIGNIIPIDETGLYFRVGRTSKSTIEVYKDGNFVDTEFETAPYTHVFIDVELEICAIAKKAKLSPNVSGIANQFIRLLNESEKASQLSAEFQINPLTDPEDFITHLKQAYSIAKFWVSFTRPNAFDVDEYFIKPTQKLINESNGKSGKTQIEGANLKSEVLEELARSAAATGDDAAAWLQPEPTERPTKKQLKGNPVLITEEEIDIHEKRISFLKRIRRLYEKIRGKD